MVGPAGLRISLGSSLAASLLAAAPGWAGADAARIEVRLSPGVSASVHLRSLDEPALDWKTPARAATASFPELPPGRYRVRVEAAARDPAQADLILGPGEAVSLRAELEDVGGRARSTLKVRERHRFALGLPLARDRLRDLPSARSLWSLLETVDASAIVDRIEGAGLAVGEPGLVGIHGASWTQTSYRLGALDITDPDPTGTPLLHPELASLEAVGFWSGALPADVGGAGPVLQLVPRRPGNAWSGSAEAGFGGGGLQATPVPDPPAVARLDSWRGGSAFAGGPLVKDRLGLALSGSLLGSRRFERDEPAPLSGRLSSLTAHLLWTPSARDELGLVAAAQAVTRPAAGRARFSPPDIEQDERFALASAAWRRRDAGGPTWSVSLGYGRAATAPKTAGRDAAAVVERLRDGPVPALFSGRSTRERWQMAASLAPPPHDLALGRHALRLGLELGRATSTTRPAEEAGPVAEAVGGLPARVWDYAWAGPESRWEATEIAGFASDTMGYGPVALAAGLRFESTSASAREGGRIEWNALSPRLGVRWRIASGGGLSAFAGAARYRHRLPLSLLAFGDPAGPQGSVHQWRDGNGDGRLDPGEIGPLIARVGPGGAVASIDPDAKPPRTTEYVLGLDARLGSAWTLRFLGVRWRERDLLASINIGAPLSSYEARFVSDPGGDILGPQDDQLLPIYDRRPQSFGLDRYLLTNPPGENALHEGLELWVERRTARLWLLLGATASRTNGPGANRGFRARENDQGLPGERRETPNAQTFSRGRLFFDRAYTFKLAATWHAPGDLRTGAVARYQDGQPFARVVIAPDGGQGADLVQAFPRGRSRFSYTLTVDARIEKGFALGPRVRVAAVLEAFNLLGQANEVEEDVTSGPGFRAVTAVQPPRALRLGLRIDF